jgi:hypothetical protein
VSYLAHAVARRSPGAIDGLRGKPLRWLGAGELGIWATEWDGERVLTRDDAFAHHDLVAALCDAGPCLPVRFGTWLSDELAAEHSIAAGRDRFGTALDRVGDRQEVAVTLLWRDVPSPGQAPKAAPDSTPAETDVGPRPGRTFLERRRTVHGATDERRRAAESLATRLGSELAAEEADVRHESCPTDEIALSMSLLARRGEAGALKARATAAVARLADVRGVVSGPWPPYSFTEELAAGGGPRGGS